METKQWSLDPAKVKRMKELQDEMGALRAETKLPGEVPVRVIHPGETIDVDANPVVGETQDPVEPVVDSRIGEINESLAKACVCGRFVVTVSFVTADDQLQTDVHRHELPPGDNETVCQHVRHQLLGDSLPLDRPLPKAVPRMRKPMSVMFGDGVEDKGADG